VGLRCSTLSSSAPGDKILGTEVKVRASLTRPKGGGIVVGSCAPSHVHRRWLPTSPLNASVSIA
jgi:hypothetical protein